jgi:hypothetical protein
MRDTNDFARTLSILLAGAALVGACADVSSEDESIDQIERGLTIGNREYMIPQIVATTSGSIKVLQFKEPTTTNPSVAAVVGLATKAKTGSGTTPPYGTIVRRVAVSDTKFQIQNTTNGITRCLNVQDQSVPDGWSGWRVVHYPCDPNNVWQWFSLDPVWVSGSLRGYQIKAAAPDDRTRNFKTLSMCLDVPNASPLAEQIQLYPCVYPVPNNEVWDFEYYGS